MSHHTRFFVQNIDPAAFGAEPKLVVGRGENAGDGIVVQTVRVVRVGGNQLKIKFLRGRRAFHQTQLCADPEFARRVLGQRENREHIHLLAEQMAVVEIIEMLGSGVESDELSVACPHPKPPVTGAE